MVLAGCNSSVSPPEQRIYLFPDKLKDCEVYEVHSTSLLPPLLVTYCPNGTTSTQYTSGKQTVRTIVVDGVKYEEKK